jgi:hypothetical protein
MTWRQLHEHFAWFVILSNAAVGLWALVAHWLAGWRYRSLWWSTAVAEASLFVQAGLGAAIIADEDIEADEFHLFYGFIALVTVGIIYSYRQQLQEWIYLLYGLGGLFLMGLAIRAMVL